MLPLILERLYELLELGALAAENDLEVLGEFRLIAGERRVLLDAISLGRG